MRNGGRILLFALFSCSFFVPGAVDFRGGTSERACAAGGGRGRRAPPAQLQAGGGECGSSTASARPSRAASQASAGGRGPKSRARPSSVRGVSWAAAQAGGCTRTACHLRHQHVGWAGLIERRRLGAQEWPLGAAQSCSDTRPKVLQATPGKLN